jgi:transcriptional regulator with XRE-family HTH domain
MIEMSGKKAQNEQKNSHRPLTNEEILECSTLKNVWRQSNLTQEDFARELGLSRSQVGRMIRKERPCGPKVRAALAQYQRTHGGNQSVDLCSGVTECVIRDALYYEMLPYAGEAGKGLAARLSATLHDLLFEPVETLTRAQYVAYCELLQSHLNYLSEEKDAIQSVIHCGFTVDPAAELSSNWPDALTEGPEEPEEDEETTMEQQRMW